MSLYQFDTPTMVYSPEASGIVFTYTGGYINVGSTDSYGDYNAGDCINLYGRSEALTVHNFQQVCDAYLEENPEDEEF
jgi:hypothetical protein